MDKTAFNDAIVYLVSGLSVCLVIVNTVCITVIMKSPELRKRPAIIFIVNLLVTHLLQGVIVLPIYAVKKAKTYPIEMFPFVCDTWRMTYMLSFYGTCINVLLVAFDRFIATKYAMSQKVKLTCKRCVIICCLAWLYLLVLCLIPFIPLTKSVSLQNSHCHYNQPTEWTIFMLLFNTVLPFLLVFAIYLYIILILRRSNQNIDSTGSAHINQKVTSLTIKITVTYGLTWLPSIVYYNIVTMSPETFPDEFYVSDAEAILTFLIKYITFFDGAVAPLLYCCSSRDFRKAFFRLTGIRGKKVNNFQMK